MTRSGGRGDEREPRIVRPTSAADRVAWGLLLAVVAPAALVGVAGGRACARPFIADPSEEMAAASADLAASAEASSAPSAPTSSSAAAPSPSTAPTVSTDDTSTYAVVTVGKPTLLHCQDPPAAELKPSRCGEPGLDATLVPKLEALGACAASTAVTGKLSVTVDASFKAQALKVIAGRSTTIARSGRRDDRAIEPLLACLRASLADVVKGDGATGHEHGRYVISYPLTFAPPAGAAPTGAAPTAVQEKPASGSATVQVDTAIVRDAPSTTGAPIGRVSRGTKVTVIGTSQHWYHVRFGDGDTQDGWIFRTNLGK